MEAGQNSEEQRGERGRLAEKSGFAVCLSLGSMPAFMLFVCAYLTRKSVRVVAK